MQVFYLKSFPPQGQEWENIRTPTGGVLIEEEDEKETCGLLDSHLDRLGAGGFCLG